MNDSGSTLLITADGGNIWRGKIIPLKEISDEALAVSPKVEHVIVYKRTGEEVAMKQGRDFWWSDLVASAKKEIVKPEVLTQTIPFTFSLQFRDDWKTKGNSPRHRWVSYLR